jgi:hypothetical protein
VTGDDAAGAEAGAIGVRHANRCVACPYKTTRCVSEMLKRIDTG